MLKAWFSSKVKLPKSSSTVQEKELDYFLSRNNCNYIKFGFCNEWVHGRGRVRNRFHPPKNVEIGTEIEYVVIEGRQGEGNLMVVSLSMPCRKLELHWLEETEDLNRKRTLWCWDFKCKSYCILWRSDHNDYTGQVVEMLLDGKHFVKCQWWQKPQDDIWVWSPCNVT